MESKGVKYVRKALIHLLLLIVGFSVAYYVINITSSTLSRLAAAKGTVLAPHR